MAQKKSKLVEIKTQQTEASVEDFLNAIADASKRKDSYAIMDMMKKTTGETPRMWGGSIIGFGNKIYTSPKTGRAVNWLTIGFSPRKANISLYLSLSIKEHSELLQKLGKHKTGVGCLYINKLDDIDEKVLLDLIEKAYWADS